MKNIALSCFALASLAAQSTGPTFDVVSVKVSQPNDGRYVRGCKGGPGTRDAGLWQCTNATVTMLVVQGYGIKRYQLVAPDWTGSANYEISAKVPAGTTKEQFREMIQGLLTERFKLEFHWSKREMAVYDLVAGKGGPKLKAWTEPVGDEAKGPATDEDGYPNIAKDCNGCMAMNAAGKARYRTSKGTVKALADMIGNQLGMQVNDDTRLAGDYDITLSWSSGGGIGRRTDGDADADAGLPIEAAVQEQLGLKLVPTKGLVDVIVVDKAERNLGEN